MSDPFTGHADDCGCQEYNALSRRQFITDTAGASAVAASALFPSWLPRVVMADSYDSARDVIIQVFLRGGVDGLTLCVPWGDPNYYAGRATIAIPRPDSSLANKAIDLTGFFAMPPAMSALLPAYQAQDLLFVHACGQVNNSRSHFDAQRWMEIGKAADPTLVTGWLGRHLASTDSNPMKTGAPLRALGLSAGLQKVLVGAPKTLPIASPGSFTIGGTSSTAAQRLTITQADYANESEPLHASALDAANTVNLLASVNVNGYTPPGVTYPNTSFARALKSVAALIAADIGIEAAAIDLGGWDTHSTQSPVTPGGSMYTTMQTLSQGLFAFYQDIMVNRAIRSTVVAMSEFGRNAKENGSGGTDHGRATAMLAMGKGINGGRVLINTWPGLAAGQLENNQDLKVTLDFRDVLAEIVRNRLGNAANVGMVFPGYTPNTWGVTR